VASRHNGKIWQGSDMTEGRSIEELDRRIAILRDNLRQLIEQAAARSGAADEALSSDRIAQQSEELDRLTKERAALVDEQGES
jgi:predicted ATPase